MTGGGSAVTGAPSTGFLANIRGLFNKRRPTAVATSAAIDQKKTDQPSSAPQQLPLPEPASQPAAPVAATAKCLGAKGVAVVNTTTLPGNTTMENTTDALPPILAMGGPLDATRDDFADAAKILDSDEFRSAVLAIVLARHPKEALVPTAVLKAIIQAVTLDVDQVSPSLFAPLLIAILKQVFAVKVLRENRAAKILLTLELVKAFVSAAYGADSIPSSMRVLCAVGIDSLLAVIVKDNGSLVQAKKLRGLVEYQLAKSATRRRD